MRPVTARETFVAAVVWSLAAGCSSVGDEGRETTDAAAGPSADALEALTCATHADCASAAYDRPVSTVADCYCPTCSTIPLNRATEATYFAQWQQVCAGYMSTTPCAQFFCALSAPTLCAAGLCRTGSFNHPAATCPADSVSGCPEDGIRCGDSCCRPGEWCDDMIQVCRCGLSAGCGSDQVCGKLSYPAGTCGGICCAGPGSTAATGLPCGV